MIDKVFVDTNILVYSRDLSEPEKQPRALEWVAVLWESRLGRISTQVLSEFFVTVTGKLTPGMTQETAWQDVGALMAWEPISIDIELLHQARTIQGRYDFSWWDCMIAAAAHLEGAPYLLSEDFQEDQIIEGVRVVNPFHTAPEALG